VGSGTFTGPNASRTFGSRIVKGMQQIGDMIKEWDEHPEAPKKYVQEAEEKAAKRTSF